MPWKYDKKIPHKVCLTDNTAIFKYCYTYIESLSIVLYSMFMACGMFVIVPFTLTYNILDFGGPLYVKRLMQMPIWGGREQLDVIFIKIRLVLKT